MLGKRPWVRRFAFLWAALQVLSPGASALADGIIARDNQSAAQVHVEAPGSKGCPQVHSPDCGVCRYLSAGADIPPVPAIRPIGRARTAPPAALVARCVSAVSSLPHGRAPPQV